MIDFKKKVDKEALSVVTDPIAIYAKLDRASDKGELRQVQRATLAYYGRPPGCAGEAVKV